MKIIQKYILKEILPPIFLSMILFTFILLLDRIFDLVDLYFKQGASIWLIFKLLLLILPNIFSLTIPMAILLGSIIGFGRLSEDGEITAFRSSGNHLWHIIWPLLSLSVFLSIFLIFFNSDISPKSQNAFKQLYLDTLKEKPLAQLEEKTFIKLPDYYLYIKNVNKKTGILKGIHIYRLDYPNPPEQIFAQEGTSGIQPNSGITLFLKNGSIQKLDQTDTSKSIFTYFQSYTITIAFSKNTENQKKEANKNLRSYSSGELRQLTAEYRQKQLPTSYIETELNLRTMLAFAPLVFMLIGISLGIKLEKGAKSLNFGISLLVLFGYYLLLIGAISIAEKKIIFPWLAMWLPNIIIGSTGIYFLRNILKK